MFRSNTGSTVAAALLILMVHQRIILRSARQVILASMAILGLVLFGSLATGISVVFALWVLVSVRRNKRRPAFAIVLGFLLLTGTAYIAAALPHMISPVTQAIAQLYGKTPDVIGTFTGRMPLWLEIWEVSKSQPLGSGFAATERSLTADDAYLQSVGWAATHSHSGYISAWLGAGWLGCMLLVSLFVSLWRQSRKHSPEYEPLIKSFIVLLAINNLTIAGVGGQWTLAWVLMTALSCAPVKAMSAVARGARFRVKPGISGAYS